MAWIEEKTITLTGDRPVVIRTATPADARALREFQLKVFADSQYMIHKPEEYQRTVREEKRLLKVKSDSPTQIYLLAESNDAMVALLTSRVDLPNGP